MHWSCIVLIELDDDLIQQAVEIGKHKTAKETVTAALKEYGFHNKQQDIIDIFGSVDFDSEYDYKKMRNQ